MAARESACTMLCLLILAGCGRAVDPKPAAVVAATPVKLIVVKAEPYAPELSSFGSISFRSKANIAATVEGTVKSLSVDEGARVKQGDVLAELENIQVTIQKNQAESRLQSARAAVELARAQLWEGKQNVEARLLSLEKTSMQIDQKKREAEELKATLASREQLFAMDGISEEQLHSLRLQCQSAQTDYEGLLTDYEVASIGLRDQDITAAGDAVPQDEAQRKTLLTTINTQTLQAQLDAAQANLQTAASDLQAANALLDEMTIRAPVAGIVGARMCGVGERMKAGDALYTLIDNGEVYAVFMLAESKGAAVSEGMGVEVNVPSLGDRLYHSTIAIVSPILDPQSGSITVRALLPNTDGRLKPGLFIRVRVHTTQPRQAILVPKTAFVSRNGSEGTVFIARSGRCFKRTVGIGPEIEGDTADKLEVRTGLAEGDQVVDEPSPVLQDGGEEYEAR